MVTPIRLYLLYCTLYFLSLTRSGYRATAALSFTHVLCLSQLSQCTCQGLQILHIFFRIDFTLKSAKTISFLLDTDTVSTALHPVCLLCFLCAIFFFDPISQWLLQSFILLGNSSLPLLGLPQLLTFLKICLKLTMVRPSRQQLPLRSSFARTIRRNQLSGSASSRRCSLRQSSSC